MVSTSAQKLVKEEDGSEPADRTRQAARPDAFAETKGKSGAGETEERREQHGVEIALLAGKAVKEAARWCFLNFGFDRCLFQLRHLSLHLPTFS